MAIMAFLSRNEEKGGESNVVKFYGQGAFHHLALLLVPPDSFLPEWHHWSGPNDPQGGRMRISNRYLISLILCLLVMPTLAYVQVSGAITTDTTWGLTSPAADGIYWVTGAVTVSNGAILTIEPGVIVKFDAFAGIYLGQGSSGTLSAVGTAPSPILLTSILDDSIGGDTNGDGNATSPGPGDWMQIRFDSGGGGVMDYVSILYAGRSSNGALELSAGAPSSVTHSVVQYASSSSAVWFGNGFMTTFSNNTISNSTYEGVSTTASGLLPPTFSSNTFDSNGSWPLHIYPSDAPRVASDNVFTANNGQGVYLNVEILTAGTHTWLKLSVPWVVSGGVTIPVGSQLDFSPGCIVKMAGGSFDANVGTLNAVGTLAEPIVFTSVKDDAVGGDTNSDGSATSPAPGDWGFLRFREGGTGALEYCTIRYAGAGVSQPAVDCIRGFPTQIKNCAITDNQYIGLTLTETGTCAVDTSTFDRNGSYPIVAYPDFISGIASSNTFSGNAIHAVQIFGGSLTSGVHSWSSLPVPYYVPGGLGIDPGATANISPGAIFKLERTSAINVNGTLNAVGTSLLPITFTSARDDTAGGDTFGDGSTTTPAPDDWTTVIYAGLSAGGTLDYVENAVRRVHGCDAEMQRWLFHYF